MLKIVKNIILVLGVMIQIMAVLFYSFSEVSIPGYLYLIVWILCAAFVKSSVNYGKRI